jgi:hypothetical protein
MSLFENEASASALARVTEDLGVELGGSPIEIAPGVQLTPIAEGLLVLALTSILTETGPVEPFYGTEVPLSFDEAGQSEALYETVLASLPAIADQAIEATGRSSETGAVLTGVDVLRWLGVGRRALQMGWPCPWDTNPDL